MEQKLVNTRMIAWALAVLLIIAIAVIWHDQKTIATLKAPASQNITAQQDIIRADCSATDPDSRARCADDLQNLSDLLGQFSKSQHPFGTSTSPIAPTKIQINAPLPQK